MTRSCRSAALLALLRAHGIDVDGVYDSRASVGDIPPGMLYSSDGIMYHIPQRPGRKYIGTLVPGTAEALAYIGTSTVVELPAVPWSDPEWQKISRVKQALEKK